MDFNHLDNEPTAFFESILFEGLGHDIAVNSYQYLGGGCINNAVRLNTSQGYFFVKWNESSPENLFACEAKGLELLREAGEIHIPEVFGYGRKPEGSYLILEYINSSRPHPEYWKSFATSLAKLHSHTHKQNGLEYDNYIGALKQSNQFCDSWVEFFIEKRLKVQAGLALYNGAITQRMFDAFQPLYEKLPNLLQEEKPSLLHGDLWSGNVIVGSNGFASLIDPAVYYGNREVELAFTKLFGGFPPEFYKTYMEITPFTSGFEERIEIYNLYPLLVHVNLFGSGYISGIERTLQKFC